MDYVEAGAAKYQQRFAERKMKYLHKLAHRYNFRPVRD
jgi:hypothetical protein